MIGKTITVVEKSPGETVTIDRKPGGADITVTEENKREYVDLMVEYYISKCVQDQFDAFMSGFNEVIPRNLINVFDEHELKLLIGGSPRSVCMSPFPYLHTLFCLLKFHQRDNWTRFTVYGGYKSNDKVIQWFWKCARLWPAVRRSRLLQFATYSRFCCRFKCPF